MPKVPPSIFNDVLGPVMRGPSSSHSAAALRIGRLARDLMGGDPGRVVVEYDPNGSLVTTHASQGSDLGLAGGLMGWETDDPRLPGYREEIAASGIDIEGRDAPFGATHPNTYKLTLTNPQGERTLTAISTGGGMIEVVEIEGFEVAIAGDYFELLVFLGEGLRGEGLAARLSDSGEFEEVEGRVGGRGGLLVLKSRTAPGETTLSALSSEPAVSDFRVLAPVLPVLARRGLAVRF